MTHELVAIRYKDGQFHPAEVIDTFEGKSDNMASEMALNHQGTQLAVANTIVYTPSQGDPVTTHQIRLYTLGWDHMVSPGAAAPVVRSFTTQGVLSSMDFSPKGKYLVYSSEKGINQTKQTLRIELATLLTASPQTLLQESYTIRTIARQFPGLGFSTPDVTTILFPNSAGSFMVEYRYPDTGISTQGRNLNLATDGTVPGDHKLMPTNMRESVRITKENRHHYVRTIGKKQYELTDHLGNVRVAFTDRKMMGLTTGDNIGEYDVDVLSMTDYYPFGMQMPGRSYNSGAYRYGFQGQEKDDEVKGSGNHLSFGDFGYDSRLGRRWNIDPVVKHHESSYAAFANNPMWFTDSDGLDTLMIHRKYLYTKHKVETFLVTFSVIRDGVEYSMDQIMYMGSLEGKISLPKGAALPLNYDREMTRHEGDWKNIAIHVDYTYTRNDGTQGNNLFIHPTSYPVNNTGCIGCSRTEPTTKQNSDGVETFTDLFFDDTKTALMEIREIYVNSNGGENGGLLTGENNFVLKTESSARTQGLRQIEPIGSKPVEREQSNRNVRTN